MWDGKHSCAHQILDFSIMCNLHGKTHQFLLALPVLVSNKSKVFEVRFH